jgi:hypothetical protein
MMAFESRRRWSLICVETALWKPRNRGISWSPAAMASLLLLARSPKPRARAPLAANEASTSTVKTVSGLACEDSGRLRQASAAAGHRQTAAQQGERICAFSAAMNRCRGAPRRRPPDFRGSPAGSRTIRFSFRSRASSSCSAVAIRISMRAIRGSAVTRRAERIG